MKDGLMGAWDVGIFDDDVACDVRNLLEQTVTSGADVEFATRTVLQTFADVIEDPDDGAVVYLALAALQVEHGVLLPRIRAAALDVIDGGQDLLRWDDAEDVMKRKLVLEGLKHKLL